MSKTKLNTPGRLKTSATLILLSMCIARGNAFAQTAPSQSQGTQATLLPLSGRATQSGSVTATQSSTPGVASTVNTLNPTVQVQGAYSGSTSGFSVKPFSGKLSLREAVQRGLEYNLGVVGLAQTVRQAHGQTLVARSVLLPNLTGDLAETVQQTSLAASGFNKFKISGLALPTVIGPFNYIDLRARLSQNIVDLTAWKNYKSADETLRANRLSFEDSRDLVVLAVGGAYLQVLAAKARVQSAHARLDTANALYQQASQQRAVGVMAQVDVDRTQVEALTQQQRVTSLENDFAKQKINLARITGLPPNDQYDLSDAVPFSAAPPITVEEALQLAFEQRSDLKAAAAQARAADLALSAARSERLPSLSVDADYGVIGTNPAQSHGTFSVIGTLRFPIWEGGRTQGDIEQADASATQRHAELDDWKLEVESEIRKVYLDLQAATSQVEVAQKNVQVAKETLELTRQRVEAGVANSVELVQSQESLAGAELDYISSVFAHNVAKLNLARAIGRTAENLPKFLSAP
ncbi:MAG: TolC family protein [Candidatus Acidiferrales bacterium]|jgi:outer membrane protein TolC